MPGHETNAKLDAYFMPYTWNRHFKQHPRLMASAEGVHYTTTEGQKMLDAAAGLWCVNAGHARKKITEAISAQAAKLDYATSFNLGHPLAFELAERYAKLMPGDIDHVYYSNSGSEAVDTALKIALAYHRAKGQGQRVRFIGRERAYHGVGFGGMSVGGITGNRKVFGQLLPFVDHIAHTYDRSQMAYSKGQPAWGAHLADELEKRILFHDPSTVAAVIVEPMSGSTGVLVPPKGYLERLREICDKYGVLLIFDEVITGFGRLSYLTAAERFGVTPDMLTTAKGMTNGCVPMGATFMRKHIYEGLMVGPEMSTELYHGYTYSGHPLACAAAMATLDIYEEEDLFGRARALEPYLQEAMHSLKGEPFVVDIRNIGIVGCVELESRTDGSVRGFDAYMGCYERGVLPRYVGDQIVVSPPLTFEKSHVDQMVEAIRASLRQLK